MNNINAPSYFKKIGANDVFSWWDPEHDDRAHLYLWEVRKIGEWLKLYFPLGFKKIRILEIASGKGRIRSYLGTKHLKILPNNVDYTVIEINQQMLNYSKNRFKGEGLRVNSILGDAHNLPFNKNSFDIVICVETFVHLPKLRKVVKEIGKVLKPNGFLISNVDLSTSLRRKVKNIFFMINSKINSSYKHRGSGIFKPYGLEEYENILLKEKFTIINKLYYGLFAPIEIEIYDKDHRVALINKFISQKLFWLDKLLSYKDKLSSMNTYFLTISKNEKN